MEWFKINHDGWLDGRIRQDSTPAERGVFVDLMALASRCTLRDGTLRTSIDCPMSRERIIKILDIPIELLNSTIDKGQKDVGSNGKPRIEVWEDGTISIPNWSKYQDKSEKVVKQGKAKDEKQKKAALYNLLSQFPEVVDDLIKESDNHRQKLEELDKTNEGFNELYKKGAKNV